MSKRPLVSAATGAVAVLQVPQFRFGGANNEGIKLGGRGPYALRVPVDACGYLLGRHVGSGLVEIQGPLPGRFCFVVQVLEQLGAAPFVVVDRPATREGLENFGDHA